MDYVPPSLTVLMYQDIQLPVKRKKSDLTKLTTMMQIALEKGLDNVQLKELEESLQKLPKNKYYCSIAGTKGADGKCYYYLIKEEENSSINNLIRSFGHFFTASKKKQSLKEKQTAQEITKSYIGDIIEEAIEKGLSEEQLKDFQERTYALFYTRVEIALTQNKKEKNKVITIALS